MELSFEPAMNRVTAVSDRTVLRICNDQLVRDDWINEHPIADLDICNSHFKAGNLINT